MVGVPFRIHALKEPVDTLLYRIGCRIELVVIFLFLTHVLIGDILVNSQEAQYMVGD